ncbi:MAG: archaetidylserine decarboxylase, partial [Myxococcales bacterium]
AELEIGQFPTFGDFFTRRLRPGARPIAPGDDVVVSPTDGLVAAVGTSVEGRLVQVKGREYSVAALLDDPDESKRFEGGAYCTIYLAPRDYHRIHSPVAGEVEKLAYIPGELWPVNPPAVRSVPNLFAVNERLISYVASPVGRVAVVKVGATCVGRIRATYDDVVTNSGGSRLKKEYEQKPKVEKGGELGVFEMGSTVILLFEPGRVALDEALVEGTVVRMGQAIGKGKLGNGK